MNVFLLLGLFSGGASAHAAGPDRLSGRKCPGDRVTIAGRDVLAVFETLGIEREAGATDEELVGYSKNFDRSDASRDGRHSKTEYIENGRHLNPRARRGIFGAADNNADGFVTRVEYALNRAITDEAKALVQPTDADGDGRVTRAEFIKGLPLQDKALAAAVFDGLDTNGDGATTIPEYLRVWGGWARPNYIAQEEALRRRLKALLPGLLDVSLFDMTAIRDASTLASEILQDWHAVDGPVPTRQKLVTIHVGEMWPGQPYRMPVRMVVPADRKAKGFHLTGASNAQRIKRDPRLSPVDQELIKGGVGVVHTVVQVLQQSGLGELGRESEERFARTLNARDKIQYWAWPATLMRAITAAHAESGHFEPGKVAMSGGSKNGATPSMAIIHDERMTAVHATVSPIWDSPLRLCERHAWQSLEAAEPLRHAFLGGHFGPNYNRAALAAGRSWEDLQAFAASVSDGVFISRNIDALHAREVGMLFHPGTHDFVAFDLAWGGAHHASVPVYLRANSGHGKKGRHPGAERDEQNKAAFLLGHFFEGVEPLLRPPEVTCALEAGTLRVTVRFDPESGEETARIFWIFDRPADGSPGYLQQLIPDENWADMQHDRENGVWTAAVELDPDAVRIDFFTNHRKTVRYGDRGYRTYISCPYTRVSLPVQ